MRENDALYKELTNVPPVPSDAFRNIKKKIHRNGLTTGLLFTIAASLLIAVSGTSWLKIRNDSISSPLNQEVASELQIARDFLNGDDLENEENQYVFYTTDDF